MEDLSTGNEKEKAGVDDGPFLFRGENLALDLVNTVIVWRGKRQDLLAMPQDVAVWHQAASRHHVELKAVRGANEGSLVYNTALLSSLTTLRAALRAIADRLVEEKIPAIEDLNVLNRVLKTGYPALDLTEQEEFLYAYHTDSPQGTLLLPIALSAAYLISHGERKRLHQCNNENCILFFYDTTKSATRRWCSLGCMDRARSAQRYRQTKRRVDTIPPSV